MKSTDSISSGYLAECFLYNEESGDLIWKPRPISHFPSDKQWRKFSIEFAGRVAGSIHGGYRRFCLTVDGTRRHFYVHRTIWCLKTGAWPVATLDHIDGNRSNNRWINLRAATHQQNNRNTPVRCHCKSGFKGVQETKHGRYLVSMTVEKKRVYFGTFGTIEEAKLAYAAKASVIHGEFLHTSIEAGAPA